MQTLDFKYLKFIDFKELSLWDVKRYIGGLNFSDRFEIKRIGDFLEQYKERIDLKDDEVYKQITVKLYGKGVILRDEKKGSEIKTKSQYLVKKGQLIFSKIDARNGAFGIVPNDLDNAIITNSFSVYKIKNNFINKVNINYVYLLLVGEKILNYFEGLSSGTTGRRNISNDIFEDTKIPLPSLEIQNKLVKNYKEKIELANQKEKEAEKLEKEIENYLMEELGIEIEEKQEKKKGLQFVEFKDLERWGVDYLLNSLDLGKIFKTSKFKQIKLKDIVKVNPKTDFGNIKEISFIPMKYISDEEGKIIKMNTIEVSKSKGYTKFKEGDLLWSRITPCMENGKSAIAKNLLNGYGCGSTEYHVIRNFNNNIIKLEYIYFLLRQNRLLQFATKYFTGTAGQQRVPKEFLENLQIPLPPLETQEKIVEHIGELKEKIKNLKNEAEELRKNAKSEFEREFLLSKT